MGEALLKNTPRSFATGDDNIGLPQRVLLSQVTFVAIAASLSQEV